MSRILRILRCRIWHNGWTGTITRWCRWGVTSTHKCNLIARRGIKTWKWGRATRTKWLTKRCLLPFLLMTLLIRLARLSFSRALLTTNPKNCRIHLRPASNECLTCTRIRVRGTDRTSTWLLTNSRSFRGVRRMWLYQTSSWQMRNRITWSSNNSQSPCAAWTATNNSKVHSSTSEAKVLPSQECRACSTRRHAPAASSESIATWQKRCHSIITLESSLIRVSTARLTNLVTWSPIWIR